MGDLLDAMISLLSSKRNLNLSIENDYGAELVGFKIPYSKGILGKRNVKFKIQSFEGQIVASGIAHHANVYSSSGDKIGGPFSIGRDKRSDFVIEEDRFTYGEYFFIDRIDLDIPISMFIPEIPQSAWKNSLKKAISDD